MIALYSPNGTDRRFLKPHRRRDAVEATARSRPPEDAGASVGCGGAVWALVANGGADETARAIDAALFEMAMAIEHAGTERACIVTGSVDSLARAALWVAVGGEVVAIPAAWAMPSHLLVEAVCALFYADAKR